MSILSLLKERGERQERTLGEHQPLEHFDGSKIVVYGWRIGFNKVEATKLLRRYCGYGLKEAKDAVDHILSGEIVSVAVPDMAKSELIAAKLQKIGAEIVPKSKRKTYHVVPNNGNWSVIAEGGRKATRVFPRKTEAVKFARDRVKGTVIGELVVHGLDGKIARKLIYSKDSARSR